MSVKGERLYDDEALLQMIRDAAAKLGRTPGQVALRRAVGWNVTQTLHNRFGSYRRACELAGLTPNARVGGGEKTYTDQIMWEAFARLTALVGHEPSIREWDSHRNGHEPASVTIRNRFGSWPAFMGSARSQLQLQAGGPSSPREKNGVVA